MALRRCQQILLCLSHEEIDRLAENVKTTLSRIELLKRLRDDPDFPQLPASFRAHTDLLLLKYRHELRTYTGCFREAQQRTDLDDPLLPLLRQEFPAKRGKGKPAYPRSTLFIVLLSEHVQAQHGQPRYLWVGRVAARIFPECFSPDVLKDPRRLARCVLDRCRKFRERHAAELPRLREAVLSTTASQMS
jgi:hypothetical protein